MVLPPGRLKLLTRPSATGSLPLVNTIGIVEVAARAARAGSGPPLVTMTLALAGTRREAGVSVAEVNLSLVQHLVVKMEVGEQGVAYVVDSADRVIAHRNPALLNADFSSLADVQAARAASAGTARSGSWLVQDSNSRELLSAYAAVAKVGWLLFVELPATEADALAR